jgi:hypothetical protein
MPSPAELSPQNAYAEYMHALRERIRRVDKIISGHSPMKNEEWDTEMVCLLLRKSLEHMAFASLVAHREAYSAVFTDFETHWSAKRLLQKLAKVHPDFYPLPVSFPVQQSGPIKQLEDVADDFLTKDDFVAFYDVCSQIIHTRNPYKPGPWVIHTGRPLSEWTNRLKRLLDVHYIRLSGVPGVWVVQMVHPLDGKVHVFSCEPIEGAAGAL